VQSFTARMPLLVATSTFRLGRRHCSSPQQCYLHCLRTFNWKKDLRKNTIHHIYQVVQKTTFTEWWCWIAGERKYRKQQSISKILNSQQEDDPLPEERHLATKSASIILLDSDSGLWKWPLHQQTCRAQNINYKRRFKVSRQCSNIIDENAGVFTPIRTH